MTTKQRWCITSTTCRVHIVRAGGCWFVIAQWNKTLVAYTSQDPWVQFIVAVISTFLYFHLGTQFSYTRLLIQIKVIWVCVNALIWSAIRLHNQPPDVSWTPQRLQFRLGYKYSMCKQLVWFVSGLSAAYGSCHYSRQVVQPLSLDIWEDSLGFIHSLGLAHNHLLVSMLQPHNFWGLASLSASCS